jgi:hypothetical protein
MKLGRRKCLMAAVGILSCTAISQTPTRPHKRLTPEQQQFQADVDWNWLLPERYFHTFSVFIMKSVVLIFTNPAFPASAAAFHRVLIESRLSTAIVNGQSYPFVSTARPSPLSGSAVTSELSRWRDSPLSLRPKVAAVCGDFGTILRMQEVRRLRTPQIDIS